MKRSLPLGPPPSPQLPPQRQLLLLSYLLPGSAHAHASKGAYMGFVCFLILCPKDNAIELELKIIAHHTVCSQGGKISYQNKL